ncbi:MAG: DUF885 family protein [Sphingomonadales bacterium]
MAEPNNGLVALFEDWRAFEKPAMVGGAPDYSAPAMVKKHEDLKAYQARLAAMDMTGWPVEWQVDYHLIRAEMNGLDFNIRVLQPWTRDPAFYTTVWSYQSDTPAHEGPTHHGLVELWTYSFPLSKEAQAKLATELAIIPPFLNQAQGNLTGNARDLWIAGIQNLKGQSAALKDLQNQTRKAKSKLRSAISAALIATVNFISWLEAQAPFKTGPSGIGKENYTWHLQNVHLIPMTWEDEVQLLKRELSRAHAALKLEEQRNRDLPPLTAISSPEEFDRRANEAVSNYMTFLAENKILPIKDYMDPAMRAQVGRYVEPGARNFFVKGLHLDPLPLYTHWYHWWDLARMAEDPNPNPIRRGPLLYNIWDSRSEGLSTAMEEMMMHAGLYDDNPRAREIVLIMVAQRAARGLGSLYAQANDFTMKEARDFHVKWTPRGWMNPELDLLGFEQQLYLRQPGYGTSYITGKYLIDELIKDVSSEKGDDFSLYSFFEEIDALGVIPVSLIRMEMTNQAK